MKALLKLPENWHVVVNNENKELLEQWVYSHHTDVPEDYRNLSSEAVTISKFINKPIQCLISSLNNSS